MILSLVILAVLAFYIWGVQGLEVYGVCLVLQGVLLPGMINGPKEFRRYYRRPGWIFLQAEELICLTVVAFLLRIM